MNPSEIKKRFDSLVGSRKVADSNNQVIERFVVPYRGEFFREQQQETEIRWRRREIYDDTAVKACRNLAANLHSNLSNPAVQWFEMRFRDDELAEDQEAQEWLEECTKNLWQELQESNFNLEVAEAYLDMCSFGTSVVIEEAVEDAIGADWEGVAFQAVPQRDAYFEMGSKNQLLRFYRRLEWTPLQMLDKWGDALPQDVKRRAESANATDDKETIIFCIYLREDKKDADTTQVLAPEARPFGYKYILHRSAEELGKEGGYYEMPAFATRFSKVSGSVWGHSPAHICLADILTLNEAVFLDQRALEKAIDPPNLTTENGLLSDLDLESGGLTIVADIDGLRPYVSGARFDVSKDRVKEMQESIISTFYGDELQLKESPAMTATEVERRWQLMQKALGPTVGRIASDFFTPMLERTFFILLRAGRLPEIPDVVANAGGVDLDMEYTGPIPRAQRLEQARLMESWLMLGTAISEHYPQVLAVPDVATAYREIGKLRGVPAKAMKSEDETNLEITKGKNQLEAATEAGLATQMAGAKSAMDQAGANPANVVPIAQGQGG